MKRFMTTTAIALLIGTSAMADDHTAPFSDTPFNVAVDLNASEMIGARVYATENDTSAMTSVSVDQTTEWDDIGEINDIILTRDGAAQSVIVGVGGFLGMGEKDVSINMSDLRFISDGESPDDYFIVINSNVAGVTDAPAYDRTAMEERAEDMADVAHDEMKEAGRDLSLMTPPVIERDGYQATMVEDLTAEDLTGARVYGPSDEDIGEIDEILLTDSGELDRAVIDVGGFLGLGERSVAVSFEELTIIRTDEGDDVRIYIDSSQEALEAKPAYEN